MRCWGAREQFDEVQHNHQPFVRHALESAAGFCFVLSSSYRDCRDRALSHWRRLANSGLDGRPKHNGNSLLGQCGPLRTGTLLHHWAFPSGDGGCDSPVRSWRPAAWSEWLERNRSDDSGRCDRLELPAGDVLWEIPEGSRQKCRSPLSSTSSYARRVAKKNLNGKNLDCLRAFPTHEFELLLEFFRDLLGAA